MGCTWQGSALHQCSTSLLHCPAEGVTALQRLLPVGLFSYLTVGPLWTGGKLQLQCKQTWIEDDKTVADSQCATPHTVTGLLRPWACTGTPPPAPAQGHHLLHLHGDTTSCTCTLQGSDTLTSPSPAPPPTLKAVLPTV